MHARASKIVYDEETDTVTLIGAAYLSRTENGKERDMTEGERIVYDMRNARSKVEVPPSKVRSSASQQSSRREAIQLLPRVLAHSLLLQNSSPPPATD